MGNHFSCKHKTLLYNFKLAVDKYIILLSNKSYTEVSARHFAFHIKYNEKKATFC